MNNMIFDTHAHYEDEAFDADRVVLLQGMQANQVDKLITCGCDVATSRSAMELAQQYDFIYFAAGIHPEQAATATKQELDTIKELLRHPKCKAVGEVGLDYYWEDGCPKPLQRDWFEAQILMAKTANLPVIVHDREAHQDTFDLLALHRPKGVVHCYSGGTELMRELIKLGIYIGLGGVVTFKNAKKSLAVAQEVPLERLLLETDAPYLAPVPFRGKRCDSSMIAYTAMAIAQVRGITVQEVLTATHQNACTLFSLSQSS